MSKVRSLPYLMPAPGRIQINEWHTESSLSEYKSLPKVLPEWDPAVSIQAEVVVTVDVPGIFEDCRLNSDAVLRLTTAWESSGSGLKQRGAYRDIPYSETKHTIPLTLYAQGVNLAKQVDLLVLLVIAYPGEKPQPFAPKLIGSTLLKEVYKVQLEGEGSRFPTEVIDFKDTHFSDDAGWVLEWTPSDLDQSVLGDIRLYINAKHERVKQAVSSMDESGFDIREAIRFDVARTLIYGALQNQQFLENPDHYEEGTVGSAVFNMLRMYFQSESIADLRARIDQPQSFESQLQAKLRIFWSENR